MRMTAFFDWLKRLNRRLASSRRVNRLSASVGIEALEARQVMTGWRFDFGSDASPVEAGFTRATVVTYSNSRGWGWGSINDLYALDRQVGDATTPDLTRDFHFGRDNTFQVNVANGVYDVVLQLGDSAYARDRINVDVEGKRVATGLGSAAGQFRRDTFRVTVSDGQLNVRVVDVGGVGRYWTLASLEVRPIATREAVATVELTAGWATFGQALAPDAAFESLQVGSLPTQTDVKTRWPDGSIRFAVLTAEVSRADAYTLTPAANSTRHIVLDPVPVEVRFSTDLPEQPQATAAMPATTAATFWLDGPLVREGRWAVIPSDRNGQALSGLRVFFDQRTYRDGTRHLEVTVENADDTADNQLRNLAVQIWADADRNGLLDELLFNRSELAMGSGTRFIQRFHFGRTASIVNPDLEPLFRSGALPRFAAGLSNVIDSAFDNAGRLRPEFDLLGPGDLNPYMGSPGGRPEIAPYTDWTARYLVYRRPRQADYLLRLGDLAGSWPIHLREPSTGRLVSLAERPNFWFDSRGEDHMRSANWGGSPLVPDNAHVPGGLALIPYLLTGDRYYADELAFWGNYAVLSTWPGNSPTDDSSRAGGNAAAGSGRGILVTNQVRGFAWGLRNISDAAAYLPDSHPIRPQLQRIVRENLTWLDDWTKRNTGPLNMAWLPGYGTEVDNDGQRFAQLWMYDYLAWSIQHAQQLGFTGGTRFRDQVVRIQTELFVNPSYNRDYAAPGRLAIGLVSASDDSTRYFRSLGESLTETRRTLPPGVFAGYYGVEARLALLIGMETGLDGTTGYRGRIRAALTFLNSPTLHPGMFDDPLIRSGFGLAGPDHPAA